MLLILEFLTLTLHVLQARAPNSPVLIIGTHFDLIKDSSFPPSYSEDLQQLVRDRLVK